MKLFKDRNGNLVETRRELTDPVEFWAQGGGFCRKLSLAVFQDHYTEVTAPAQLRRGAVDADFMETPLPCWSDGMHWNGWGMPYFERAAVEQLMALDTGGSMHWHGDTVVAIVSDEEERYEPHVVEGKLAWAVGAGSWCWNSVDFTGETPQTLALIYSPNGDGEHPIWTRHRWRTEVCNHNTISGYWDWAHHQLTTKD